MGLDKSEPSLGFGEFLGISTYNLVCVVAGMALGWWADAAVGSTPVLTLVGLAAGVVVGVVGTWLRIRTLLQQPTDGEPRGSH